MVLASGERVGSLAFVCIAACRTNSYSLLRLERGYDWLYCSESAMGILCSLQLCKPAAGQNGGLLVLLRWITVPASAIYLFVRGSVTSGVVVLFWPLIVIVLGVLPTTQVGRIQTMFMNCLGYTKRPI